MTNYVNPSTRNGGADQIVVPERQVSTSDVYEAPFDGAQYVRKDGDWVRGDFSEADPSNLFPTPVTHLALPGSQTVTSATWVDVGTTADLVLTRAVMVLATLKGAPLGGAATGLRGRLSWSGATTGDSYALFGNSWAGCISGNANTARDDASVTFPLVVNAGTTTFKVEAIRDFGSASCSMVETAFTLTPLAWADFYTP